MTAPILYKGHLVVGDDPRVKIMVPHAKEMMHEGQRMYIIPNSLDESKVLKNLGYDVKPPILTNYTWPGPAPFDAQRITAALITMNPATFVVNGLGTGKTRSLLYAYDYLKSIGQRRRLLVTAPLSTLRQTWVKEVMMIFPHLKAVALHGSRQKRLKLLASDADIYVINHDGVEVILPELLKRAVAGDIDMICLDELGVYKNAQSDLWKFTNRLCRQPGLHLVGMNGTPMPNGPEDAYGQIKIIAPANVPSSFTRYREKVSFKAGPFKWLPREGSTEAVHKMMQPSVRFTRDECFDIPDAQTVQRVGPLTASQQKLYNEVAKDCTAQVAAGTIKAFNEADRINKLVQISLGCVYTTDKEVQTLDCKDRLSELERCIEQSESKVIVFTPYKHTLAMLALMLKQRWIVETVSGDTPTSQREYIFTNFMHTPNPHVIVAHPACMSHGLTLTAASTIIWFGPPNSLETYEQANARISRPGQKFKQLIINLAGTKLEEKIYQRLNSRAQLQGVLLDLFESQELGDML